MVKIVFMGAVSFLLLNSCSKKSDDVIAKVETNQTCIPEAKLLAKGIVGGKRVNPTDKDSTAVAMVLSIGEEEFGTCTASLISPKVLLTAAHCIKASVDKTLVIFHTAISCESGFDSTKNSKRVSKITIHKDYIPTIPSTETTIGKEGTDDIALIILTEPAPENYAIYKIADPLEVKDSRIYFYGYGVTGSNDGGSGILRKTSFSNDLFYVEKENNKIRLKQNSGTGICFGDSGGPGLVNINGEAQILGVNSFVQGPDDDSCNGTATLALAEAYKGWIKSSLKANE